MTVYMETSSMFSTSISDVVSRSYDDEQPDTNDLDNLQSSNTVSTPMTNLDALSTQSLPFLTKDNAGKIQTYIIVALGLIFNFIALVVYTKTGCNRRRTTPIMLITTLAWIDTLAILAYVGRACLKPLLRENKPLVYCNIFGFITNFFPFASGFLVMFMSVERYTALVTPYKYHRRFTAGRVAGAVLGLVCAAALIGALPFFGIGSYERVPFHGLLMCKLFWRPEDSLRSNIQFAIYVTSGWGLVVTVIACNASVVLELIKMRRKISEMYPGLQRNTAGVEVKFVKTTLLITILFLTCWLPWMLFITYTRIGIRTTLWSDLLSHRMLLANHSLDPVVFLLTRVSIPTKLRQLLRRSRRKTNEVHPKTGTSNSEESRAGQQTTNAIKTQESQFVTTMATLETSNNCPVPEVFITSCDFE